MYKNYSSKPNSYYLVQSSTQHLFKSYNNAYLHCIRPSQTDCENLKCNETDLYYPLYNFLTSCYKNESRPNYYYLRDNK